MIDFLALTWPIPAVIAAYIAAITGYYSLKDRRHRKASVAKWDAICAIHRQNWLEWDETAIEDRMRPTRQLIDDVYGDDA